MVLTGNLQVDQKHLEAAGNTIIEEALDSAERRQAFREVAQSAKADGALAIAQISHAGPRTPVSINPYPYSVQSNAAESRSGKYNPLRVDQIKNEVSSGHHYNSKK